jgi:N-acetylmuramoyl-L-alanine amidase
VYPDSLARIAVRDSNFLFGSTGTGDADLTIDGTSVPVEPNGAFLAWLPVPGSASGDTVRYVLVARREGRADTLRWPVLVPRRPYQGEGAAWIDTAALRERPVRWARPDEDVLVRVAGSAGGRVRLSVGTRSYRMREASPGRYQIRIAAGTLYAAGRAAGIPDTTSPATTPTPETSAAPLDSIEYEVELVAGSDTARASGLVPLRLVDPAAPPVAELIEAPDTVNGRAEVVVGRPVPSGPYLWRFPDRTVAAVDGRVGDRLRLRLGPDLEAWADTADARFLPAGTPAPSARAGDIRIEHRPEALELSIPLGDRVPVRVRTEGSRLTLTLYDTRGRTNRLAYGPHDALLDGASWDQLPGRRWRLELELSRPVWGWRLSWTGGTDAPAGDGAAPAAARVATGGTLHLEVRRPPSIDPDHPLRGRKIAVDPGHPPAGAHGPTGLYEGDANLAVARRLVALLREAGAVPVLVRRDTLPVGLYERARRADSAGAELFVSLHQNALPDGVRPFGEAGTSTYYYQPVSRELAADVQAGVLRSLGLRDLGISWADLAVVRQSWMPSVLVEGAFIMMPGQEAALRTAAFQESYARGVLDGLRAFLRARARIPSGEER